MSKPVTPLLSADAIIFDAQGRLLLIRRKYPPFKGAYALPGGFIDLGETVEEGCRRELREETGLEVKRLRMVGVYSDPKRDPRGHNVSVAFVGVIRSGEPKAGDDAAAAEWVAGWRSAELAFDHGQMVADAAKLRRMKP